MASQESKLTAPYLPFKTFLSALDHLRAIGIPHQIERAVFPSFSGVIQGQVLGSLRFFKLIDERGKPQQDLAMLTDGNKERKAALREILVKHYADLIALDLTKVSPSQFDQKLGEYGVNGATHQKAKSFFLKAAQFADLPLSPLLTRKSRSSSGTRRKKPPEPNGSKLLDPEREKSSGTTKRITLRSGGELTLSLTVNVFDLIEQEREFVFDIVDRIQRYEKTAQGK